MSDSGAFVTGTPSVTAERVRPTSVTVISWIILAATAFGGCGMFRGLADPRAVDLMRQSPIPFEVQVLMIVAGLCVGFVCALGWLHGENWARWLYVIWNGLGTVVGLATSPTPLLMIPGLVFVSVVVSILCLPGANHYFTGRRSWSARG